MECKCREELETKTVESGKLEKFSVGSLDSIFYIPSFLSDTEQDYFLRQVNSAPAIKWKALKNRRLQNWGGVVHEKGLIAQPLPQWLRSVTQRISAETGLFPSPINHVLVNEYLPGQGIMPHQDGPLYFPVVAIISLGSSTIMRFSPHARNLEPKATLVTSTCQEKLTAAPKSVEGLDATRHANDEQNGQENCSSKSLQKGQNGVPKDISVILMPGSLLIFKDSAYQEYLHGIEDSIEHKVDETVVNAELLKTGDSGGVDHLQPDDTPQPITLLQTGTRISLTCRLISEVQAKFLRL